MAGNSERDSHTHTSQVEDTELLYLNVLENWREMLCERGEPLDSLSIVAHSLGAYLAGSWAMRSPDRIKKLVLCEPWGLGSPEVFRYVYICICIGI